MKTYGHFIHGQETPAKRGETFPSIAPVNGEILGYAARGTEADVEVAVSSARAGFTYWSSLPPTQRERTLLECAEAVEVNHNRLLDLLIDESGSTIVKARYEVLYTASVLRAAAGEVRRLYGDTLPNEKPHRLSMVVREPVGVVVVISPFNAPLALLAKMTAFPLGAGNAVIAKPSEETPLIAVEFAKILHEAGLPAGVFNVVTGFGPECGEPLLKHPGVNGVAFTGSTATGIRVGQIAIQTMKRLQLELGGKNPLLVLSDMDMAEAAEIAAVGAFTHGGQICMSSSRIIVEAPHGLAFANALAKKAASLYLGDLRDERTAYGPLINQRALAKVMRHVQAARESGGQILTGGDVHHGLVFQPTVVYNPPRLGECWEEETFGPVALVTEATSLEEMITIANESQYGLSAGIITNDLKRGLSAARQIRCGAVHLGAHSFQSDPMAPIGGYGMSGIGRSGGKYSIEHFTELKWISVELGETPRPF
ncbi:MAG: aldehyde dehydrogenase family protein [Chloroflexus sp.]|jgi:aldehyde dehydrogenase (NAD+)|nr:aldehyde dehydrogenase family protein [Chloroflexus sp.]MBO9348707.1 aldehyde dehydrogenase family protein [Chloroflexus sp.]